MPILDILSLKMAASTEGQRPIPEGESIAISPNENEGPPAVEAVNGRSGSDGSSHNEQRNNAIDDIEKPPFLFTTVASAGSEESIDPDDPRVRDIPDYVKKVVSLHDDPSLPTLTFRYFVLTIFFVVPGAFMSQMSSYRTTYAPYSIFFVQIAASYVGDWLARILPAWQIKFPFTKWGFNLNPGPFSVKEHVLITISAASGATYNLGYTPISMAELYFGYRVHPAAAIFFMLAIVWIGYSYAALARQFLIYDPQFPW